MQLFYSKSLQINDTLENNNDNILENNNNDTLEDTMDVWLKGTHYPELYVHRDYDDNKTICYLTLTEVDSTKWKVPITSLIQSNLTSYNRSSSIYNITSLKVTSLNVTWLNWNQQLVISDPDINSDINPDDFIIVNINQLGRYDSRIA